MTIDEPAGRRQHRRPIDAVGRAHENGHDDTVVWETEDHETVEPAGMIGRLNHTAIAVPDLDVAIRLYGSVLGAEVSAPLSLPEHGVRVAFVALPNGAVELMEPLGPMSPLTGFLDHAPGGGLHHICFEVEDLAAARDRLEAEGARVLGDGRPRIGAHGFPVLFLHPKDFCGTLIEIEERRPPPG